MGTLCFLLYFSGAVAVTAATAASTGTTAVPTAATVVIVCIFSYRRQTVQGTSSLMRI